MSDFPGVPEYVKDLIVQTTSAALVKPVVSGVKLAWSRLLRRSEKEDSRPKRSLAFATLLEAAVGDLLEQRDEMIAAGESKRKIISMTFWWSAGLVVEIVGMTIRELATAPKPSKPPMKQSKLPPPGGN